MLPDRMRSLPSVPVLASGTLLLTLVAWLALRGSVVNYDALWSLSWAQDILDGRKPGYELDGAATPHPLTTALAALGSLAGDDAARHLTRGVVYLSGGLVVALSAGLAHRIAGALAAFLTAAVLVLCSPLVTATALAFQDVIAAALLLLAVTFAVGAPRRPVPPFAALAVAGLVRPEMWGLAACWWIVQFPGRDLAERLRLAAWSALGPALWLLSDLVVTGELLFSFTHTREGAAAAQRTTGVANAPDVLYDNLRMLFSREALALAVVGGVVVTLVGLQRRRTEVGQALLIVPVTAGLLVCGFLVMAAGELSLLVRYLLPLAGLLAILFGVVAGGWLTLTAAPARRLVWGAAVLLSLLLSIGFVDEQLQLTRATVRNAGAAGDAVADLRALTDARAVADATARCGRLTTRTTRTSVGLAVALDESPASIDAVQEGDAEPIRATWVVPRTRAVRDALERIGSKGGPLEAAPVGGRRVARNRSWTVYTVGC